MRATRSVTITPRAYLRTIWMILWTAFRHPFSTTVLDLTTGQVISEYRGLPFRGAKLMFFTNRARIRALEQEINCLSGLNDWLRGHVDALDKNWSAHHDGSMNVIRQALVLRPDSSIPDIIAEIRRLQTIAVNFLDVLHVLQMGPDDDINAVTAEIRRLQAGATLRHPPSHRLTDHQIAQLDADV